MTRTTADYAQYAADALNFEESLYRRAIRSLVKLDEHGRTDPAHQPFDLQTGGADNQVIQGAQGYRIAIHAFELYNSGDACDIYVKDGVGGSALTGPLINFPTQAGKLLPPADDAYFTLSPGQSFVIRANNGVSVRLTGWVKYRLLERGPS